MTTDWVAEHLDAVENVRIVEADEDVLLYQVERIRIGNPRGMAEGLTAFFAHHPLSASAWEGRRK
jgi:hypothetical protein